MPETIILPTATPYHHFIPTPTPTSFVSVIATPHAPGMYPASVETASLTASGAGLCVVIMAGIVAAYFKLRKGR